MQEEADYFELGVGIGKLNIDDQAVTSSESNFQSTNFGQSSQQEYSNHFDEQDQTSINDDHQMHHPQVSVMNKPSNQEVSKAPNWQTEIESEAVMEVAVRYDEDPKEHLTFLTFAKVQNINQGIMLEEVDGQTYRGNENNQQDKREGFNIKKLKKKNKGKYQRKNQRTSVDLRAKSKKALKEATHVQTVARKQGSKDLSLSKKEFSVCFKPTRKSKKIAKKLFISKLSLSQKKIFDESSQKQKTFLSQNIKDLLYEEAKSQALGIYPDKDFPEALGMNPGKIFSFLPKRLKDLGESADQERLKEIKNFIHNQAILENKLSNN